MSAETLRKAAARLRDLANAATPGPWGFTDSEAAASLVNIPDDGMVVLYQGDTPVALCADEFYEQDLGEPAPLNDAQWIATMHPGVGSWLADLLDHLADEYPTEPCSAPEGCNHCADPHWSLVSSVALARLILGGTS